MPKYCTTRISPAPWKVLWKHNKGDIDTTFRIYDGRHEYILDGYSGLMSSTFYSPSKHDALLMSNARMMFDMIEEHLYTLFIDGLVHCVYCGAIKGKKHKERCLWVKLLKSTQLLKKQKDDSEIPSELKELIE